MQRTVNYELCQYEGSDKTSYLVNYNGDMLKIDTAIKNAADAAASAQTKANTADSKADTNAGNISTLNTQINGEGGLAADIVSLRGSVNTITSLIGNGEPTTTDKTLIGAINELNSGLGEIKTDLTGAIVLTAVNSNVVVLEADGVKTYNEMLSDLLTAFNTYLSGLDNDVKVEAVRLDMGSIKVMDVNGYVFTNNSTVNTLDYASELVDATNMSIYNVHVASTSIFVRTDIALADGTISVHNSGSTVAASGTKFMIKAKVYKAI